MSSHQSLSAAEFSKLPPVVAVVDVFYLQCYSTLLQQPVLQYPTEAASRTESYFCSSQWYSLLLLKKQLLHFPTFAAASVTETHFCIRQCFSILLLQEKVILYPTSASAIVTVSYICSSKYNCILLLNRPLLQYPTAAAANVTADIVSSFP